ncbi:MAG: hypothetical protein Q7N50_06665 [Armatimonadota bacterium]|nr:hypothetical protein [Armatimonadota bacterium]
MRIERKLILAVVALIVLANLIYPLAALARAQDVAHNGFESNGTLISGWHWLRNSGHTAKWTFNATALQKAKSGTVYLNFAPLVTNGVNGGSGYSTICLVTVQGVKTEKYTIKLVNPYRPIDPEISSGVGYQCYGHTSQSIPASIWKGAGTLTITISYPFSNDYHMAVNANAMSIGYSK